jgi:hypothetical protein
LRRMPALLGLDGPLFWAVFALAPWPAPQSAASRPRVILIGTLRQIAEIPSDKPGR